MWLKQSTAATVKLGPFVDDVDGKTAETGLTVSQADVRLSKNGGDMAQKNDATSCSHDEIGYYDCPLNATDTGTLGRLRVMVAESGALPVWADFMVVPGQVWDSLFGADKLQVHADEITAGLITAAAIATGAIDADALATDAVGEIADGVWDEATSGHTTAGSAGKALIDANNGTPPTAGAVAAAVWDEAVGEVTTGTEPTKAGGLLRMVFNRFYRRNELTNTTLRTYVKDGAGGGSGVLSSQTVSDDGTTQVQQQATYPS